MKYIIVTSSLLCLLSGIASAQTCQTIPSCESLGYTSSPTTDCPVTPLKCPFDGSKTYCPESSDCVAGAIYYSDGTCSQENHQGYLGSGGKWIGKTIVGVVVQDAMPFIITPVNNGVVSGNTWDDAKTICNEDINGVTNWRLPTQLEMKAITDNAIKIKIGLLKMGTQSFLDGVYWTNEETPLGQVYGYKAGSYYSNVYNKSELLQIRCVKPI